MQQLDILVDVPRARNTDPITSHRAAASIRPGLGRQQGLVKAYVAQFPGCTSAELAAHMAENLGGTWERFRPMFGRRLAELNPVHVREGEARICSRCGRPSLTWWPR